MNAGRKRIISVALLLSTLTVFLSGCWDDRELDALFIVTGVALDKASNSEQMDITLQVGKIQSMPSGSGDAVSKENSVILVHTTGDTMMEGLADINRNSSRTLLLHHNQVLLFGSALAGQDVRDRLDLFLRNQEARMEELVMVADGRADRLLATEMDQDKISGMFLWRVMKDLSEMSPYYQVRMLDFVSRLLEETTAPMAPMVTVVCEDDKNIIKMAGMAVFKEGRMVGRLSNDDVLGYLWAMGNMEQSQIKVSTDLGKASLQIMRLDCRRKVNLRQDGGLQVALDVNATVNIGELRGLSNMTPEKLMSCLTGLAEEEIRREITDTFEKAQNLQADIYGFGTSLYHKYPKQWREKKDRWDDIFSETELSVKVRVRIPSTGQIVQSLEMEENKK